MVPVPWRRPLLVALQERSLIFNRFPALYGSALRESSKQPIIVSSDPGRSAADSPLP